MTSTTTPHALVISGRLSELRGVLAASEWRAIRACPEPLIDVAWSPEPLYLRAPMPRLYGPETPGEGLELGRVGP